MNWRRWSQVPRQIHQAICGISAPHATSAATLGEEDTQRQAST